MIPHPYFSEQVAADHQQALTDQANAHRLRKSRVAPSNRRRRLGLRLGLIRRLRQLQPTRANVQSAAPTPVPPLRAPDIAVPLPPADR
jgi:hypothetical protein